jgi:hypothetical protein
MPRSVAGPSLSLPRVMTRVLPLYRDFTRRPWVLCGAALSGQRQGLSAADRAFIRQCLGGRELPTQPAREGWLIVGRRGGKSAFAAVVAIYLACFRTYRLAPGERGVFMVIAADRRQARVVKRYIAGLLRDTPILAPLIANETKEAIELTNGITIEIHTASFRAVRGYTIVGAVCDEIAFWPVDDSANPDTEILNALRPAMATVPGALLLCISSPYARRGELWRAHREHFGKTGDALVWQADTRTMNPTVPQAEIDRAYAADPAVAAAEYGAEFRRDVESFVSREALNACTVPGRLELPPGATASRLVAFVDPAGGSGGDSMTLAIAAPARRGEIAGSTLVLLREVRSLFSPDAVVSEFASELKTYGLARVTGDRYAGEWPREAFRKRGIAYDVSELTKSELYRELLPLVNSGRVELLDHPRLLAQLGALERRTGHGGRDTIDHPAGAGSHDDVANAAAGALVMASSRSRGTRTVPLAALTSVPSRWNFDGTNRRHGWSSEGEGQ